MNTLNIFNIRCCSSHLNGSLMVTFFGFDGGNELASSALCSNSSILSTACKKIAHQMKSQHLILQTLIAHLIYRFSQAKSEAPDCNNKP